MRILARFVLFSIAVFFNVICCVEYGPEVIVYWSIFFLFL